MNLPSLKIDTNEPFWVPELKSNCFFNGIIHLYVYICHNLETLDRNTNLEYSVGSVSYVFNIDETNNIQLC